MDLLYYFYTKSATEMIRVFIDESGDVGRRGRYFVLAAAIFKSEEAEKRAKRLIRKEQLLNAKAGELPTELKSARLNFKHRQRIMNKIVQYEDFEIHYLVIEKPRVRLFYSGHSRNLIYNYFMRILIDGILSAYDEPMHIVMDERTTAVKSMNSLIDYLTIAAFANHNKRANEVTFQQADSRAVFNLQVADLLAGTIFRAYRDQQNHFLNILAPKIHTANEFPSANFSRSLRSYISVDKNNHHSIKYPYGVRRMMT